MTRVVVVAIPLKVCARQTFFPRPPDEMGEASRLSWGGGLSQSSCKALYSRRALVCLHTNSPLTPLKARSGAPDRLTYPSTMALYGKAEPPDGRVSDFPLLPSRRLLDLRILLQPQSHFPPLSLLLPSPSPPPSSSSFSLSLWVI